MQKLFDKQGNAIEFATKSDIEFFKTMKINSSGDSLTALKNAYSQIPTHNGVIVIYMTHGAQSVVIAQKLSHDYFSAIIYSYSLIKPIYTRYVQGRWYDIEI